MTGSQKNAATRSGPAKAIASRSALSGDQQRPVGPSDQLPVPAGHLRRRVDRVRSPACEEHLALGDRREGAHPLGELYRRPVGQVAEGRVGSQAPDLLGHGVGDLGPTVADVAVPERRRRVEVAAPLLVPHVYALTPVHDELAARLPGGHVGERVPERTHRGVTLARTRRRPVGETTRASYTWPSING